ncbi:lipopolysaccharide export system protein LptC [Rhodovulum bhavnagarense]|uniref:Lipopolysaccharide export system protein LptC n=1 Tax=Rhodovulum bhavnagarense TaxID=992286 RepID=A0A4R2R9S5_9RHOB|nr:hypothetical protein [Rhodovulum bhavnagarense]TCP58717.1 lipopolysaccharide export system protein LptC [Rhodovulum bhavnagarense]
MASFDNAYSRFVALARIVLPLAALGILSTLFLVSRGPDPGDDLRQSRDTVAEIAREQRIGAPEFATVTADGTAVALSAETVRPDAAYPGQATADILHLRLDMAGGARADLRAARGALDMAAGQTVMEGGVRIESSAGYRLEAARVTAAMDQTDILAEGPVTGEGPAGRITAGQLQLTADPQAAGRYLLVFKDGVKLVYEPGR